jgi:hypothetical protein
MISCDKVINYKVAYLFEYYNLGLDHLSKIIWKIQKNKFQNIKT